MVQGPDGTFRTQADHAAFMRETTAAGARPDAAAKPEATPQRTAEQAQRDTRVAIDEKLRSMAVGQPWNVAGHKIQGAGNSSFHVTMPDGSTKVMKGSEVIDLLADKIQVKPRPQSQAANPVASEAPVPRPQAPTDPRVISDIVAAAERARNPHAGPSAIPGQPQPMRVEPNARYVKRAEKAAVVDGVAPGTVIRVIGVGTFEKVGPNKWVHTPAEGATKMSDMSNAAMKAHEVTTSGKNFIIEQAAN
jgi:hypothetical protein